MDIKADEIVVEVKNYTFLLLMCKLSVFLTWINRYKGWPILYEPETRTVYSLRACSIEVSAGDVKADRQIVLRRGCTLDYSEYCV